MIPIYLCEDEAPIRAYLKKEIEDYIMIQNHDMKILCETADPKKIIDCCRAADPGGIYFLDINLGMEAFNGFDLAAKIRYLDSRAVLIFVTTHGELSMETFRYRLEAMDYILKDDPSELQMRIRACIDNVQERLLRENALQSEYYTVKIYDTIHNLPVSQILYFETSPQKHKIILHAAQEIIEFFGSIQAIEETIGDGFFRCHRAYLVNRDYIRAIHLKENMIELTNGESCPLSRKAKKKISI